MPTVTYNDESYTCTTAFKGDDYIHLMDSSGLMIAAFDGITDFSGFEISDGSWVTPSPADCLVAIVNEDGTISPGEVNRAKLADNALYSPIVMVSGNVSLSEEHLGKTINFTDTSNSVDHVFTITEESSAALPIGFEAAILFAMGTSAKIVFSGSIGVGIAGEGFIMNPTLALPEKYTMVAIKKINSGNNWLVTGPVEVVS